jgi:hypothetical protein
LTQSLVPAFDGSCAGHVTPVPLADVVSADAVPADRPKTAAVAAAVRTPRMIVFFTGSIPLSNVSRDYRSGRLGCSSRPDTRKRPERIVPDDEPHDVHTCEGRGRIPLTHGEQYRAADLTAVLEMPTTSSV